MKPRRRAILIVVTVLLVCLDLATKWRIYHTPIAQTRSWVSLTFNPGSSWSLPVPLLVTIGVAVIAIGAFCRAYAKGRFTLCASVFLLAGAIGNLFDRVVYGVVRDRIHLIPSFPVFNLADVMLTA